MRLICRMYSVDGATSCVYNISEKRGARWSSYLQLALWQSELMRDNDRFKYLLPNKNMSDSVLILACYGFL